MWHPLYTFIVMYSTVNGDIRIMAPPSIPASAGRAFLPKAKRAHHCGEKLTGSAPYAQQWQVKEGASAQLVTRYYLSDAAFVAAVESEDRELLEAMAESLRRPRFPLFLGRRSCPTPPNLVLGIRDTDAVQALVDEPWHASPHHRKARSSTVYLPIHRDAKPGEAGMSKCDVPISFSQEHRQYGWRTVVVEERKASFENDSAQSKDRFFDTVISS